MILKCGCEYEDASECQTKACSVQHRDVYVGVLKDLEVAKLRMSELEDRVRRQKIAYDSLARNYEAIKDGPTCLSQELVNLLVALGSLFDESPGPHGGGSHPIVCDDWILPDGKTAGYPKFDDAIIRCRRCAERMLAVKKAFMAANKRTAIPEIPGVAKAMTCECGCMVPDENYLKQHRVTCQWTIKSQRDRCVKLIQKLGACSYDDNEVYDLIVEAKDLMKSIS